MASTDATCRLHAPEVPLTGPLDRIDEHVGPFQLVEWLYGQDGASFYRSVRPEGSREPREVGILIADQPPQPQVVTRIRRRYDALRALDDPRIPQVYGFYSGQAAVAIQWHEGVTLADVIQAWREGLLRPDPATAMDVLIELAHALRHAHLCHPEPVTHGHLRPELVLLTPEGEVVLLGFGDDPGPDCYPAPERVAGAFIDPRTDQWDLGALTIELLSGEKIPDGPAEDPEQHVISRIERRWPEVGRFLRRACDEAAGGRYPNEEELIQHLAQAALAVPGRPDRARLAEQVAEVLDRLAATRAPSSPLAETLQRPPAAAPTPIAPPQSAAIEDPAAAPPAEVVPIHGGPQSADAAPVVTKVEVAFDPDTLDTSEATSPVAIRPEEPQVDDEPAGPDPLAHRARFQPTELIGIALGVLLIVVGLIYLFVHIW